jgi:hypothetical protein
MSNSLLSNRNTLFDCQKSFLEALTIIESLQAVVHSFIRVLLALAGSGRQSSSSHRVMQTAMRGSRAGGCLPVQGAVQ